MKKPELADYGLTEDSESIYERQKNKFYAANELRKKKERNVKIWVFFIVEILSLIVVLSINSSDVPSAIIISLLISLVVLAVLDGYHGKKDEREKNFLKNSYIDSELEKKIFDYKRALIEYDAYIQRTKKEFWDNLTGYQFEEEVANLFISMGFSARVTKATGDGGVDIIIYNNIGKIAVQCKHHKSKIGPNDIRALIGVVLDGGYTSGIFVSLNGFSVGAQETALGSKFKIYLLSREDLIAINDKFGKTKENILIGTNKRIYVESKVNNAVRGDNKKEDKVVKLEYKGIPIVVNKQVLSRDYGWGTITRIEQCKIYVKFNRGENVICYNAPSDFERKEIFLKEFVKP
ncbi:MAG: restriction endonuclease [Clostridiales bacterium]|nr:restriction endonuclease [Clostridiales bacterium]